MATVKFKAGDEYAARLSALGAGSEGIAKKALYAAAGIVADRIKTNLRGAVSGGGSGGLEDSLGITPMQEDGQGGWNLKIGFDGYDSKGVPNQLKARALESGTSRGERKHPFVRPAVNASKGAALAAMKAVIDEETKKIMDK